ncbi:MAG TPA: winged helix-turn-helix domain-containing protein [Casimicrobiaceae bacterium]|nr:winged helix-turn-helix domain-containing protein [Casimicrobiaceae bacterium]
MPTKLGTAEVIPSNGLTYAFGAFRLIPKQRKLLLADEAVQLSSRAFDILVVLVEHAGSVISANELMRLVWPGVTVDEANLRVQLGSLRKALARGEGGRHAIKTVPLQGYCFVLPVVRSDVELAAQANAEAQHNLPLPLTQIVGRGDAIELLSKSLSSHRLVTVIGPGGIGKTTVALAVAHRCQAHFVDGARFVDFSCLSEPQLVAGTLASAFGIGVLSQDPLAGLLAHLRDKQMLIVLDTCEHVVEVAARLAETLLAELPGIRIMATSREALRAKGEWVHRLPSLSLPSHAAGLTAVEVISFSAIELFVQQAAATVNEFELRDADVPLVAEICRWLDGIPLAIELAAARVDELGLRELAARLHDSFSVLTRGRRTALPRHLTLHATLRWSYDLLSPDEQAILRRLAVFRGPFTADAASAVAGLDPIGAGRATELVSDLFVKSLLVVDADGDVLLYRMLDTTRAFAAELLRHSGEFDTIQKRHAIYVCDALREAERDWGAGEGALWLSKYRHLIDDVRAAFDWAASETGDRELGGRICGQSATLWFALSLLEEYGRRIEVALAAARARKFVDPAIEISLLDARGHIAWHTRGDMPTMEDSFARALAGARREGLAGAEYHALYGQIVYFATNGDYLQALATVKQLGTLAASIDDPRAIVTHRRLSAVASTFAGDHARVRDDAQYVLNHPSSMSGKTRVNGMFFDQRISSRTMLSRTLWQQGFPDQARDCAQEGLALARAIDHALSLCFVLAHGVVPIALWRGERAVAEDMTQLLLARSQEHGFFIWHGFGRAYHAALNPDAKRTLAGPARPAMGALLLETLATLDEALADDETLARGADGRAGWATPELLRISGRRLLQFSKKKQDGAEALLLRSLDSARRQSALAWELRTAISLAELWQAQGHCNRALDLLAPTRDRFSEGFATADLVKSGALLERLRPSV